MRSEQNQPKDRHTTLGGRSVVLIYLLSIVGGSVLMLMLGAGWRFHARIRGLEAQLLQANLLTDRTNRNLPDRVRAVALHAGAGQGGTVRGVRLTQTAQMQLAASKPWQPLSARQVISVLTPGFSWLASSRKGPVPVLYILDAYCAGSGLLQARLFGAIPVADAQGPELSTGEAMRYLAELPWAPDAILCNPDIAWTVAEDGWMEARLSLEAGTVLVRLRADDEGDIVEITAKDRPARLPDGSTALMDWRGLFSDHAKMGGRRIPLLGEVGYVEGGQYRPYWRGRITGYELVR